MRRLGTSRRTWFSAVLLVAAVLLGMGLVTTSESGTPPAAAQEQPQLAIFANIEGIEGESKSANHENWVDVLVFNQAVEGSEDLLPGAGRGQPADFAPFVLVKYLDRASPVLQEYVASGRHVPKLTIEAVRYAEDEVLWVRYVFDNVRFTSYNVGNTGQAELTQTGLPRIETSEFLQASPAIVEEVSFVFGRITMTYWPLSEDATQDAPVEFRWDLQTQGPG